MDNPILTAAKVFGQPLRFSSVHGEVVGVDRVTNTHVGSTSGSVAVFGEMVNVTLPRVTVTSQASKQVWVRREDGSEMSVAAPDTLEARAGHQVTVLLASGRQQGKDVHRWCAVANHTTRCWDQVDEYPPVDILNRWTSFWTGLASVGGGRALFAASMFVCVALFLGSTVLFGGGSMGMLLTSCAGAAVVILASLTAGARQARGAKADYAKAVRRAVEATFD